MNSIMLDNYTIIFVLKKKDIFFLIVDVLSYNQCVDHSSLRIYVFIGINEDSAFNHKRKDFTLKKISLALFLAILAFIPVHAQQTVVIERPGVLSDLASAVSAIVALPIVAVEGIVVGTAEATGSLLHGSTTVIVAPSAKPVPTPSAVIPVPVSTAVKTPPVLIPTTTIVTTHSDGTVTTVTRRASAYELGPNIVVPVDPAHRVGSSPFANPYVYRHK